MMLTARPQTQRRLLDQDGHAADSRTPDTKPVAAGAAGTARMVGFLSV